MSRMSRQKGKRGEREAAAELRDRLWLDARRGVQYHGGPDSPDVIGWPGVHVEAKRVESLNIHAAMAQSVAEAKAGEVPVVMHKRNRGEWMLTVRMEDLLDLYHAIDAALSRPVEVTPLGGGR